jgi:hypothetical protein
MPNNNVFFLSFTFGSKNNNILKLGTILIMKLASACLRVFFQIVSMIGRVNTPLVEHLVSQWSLKCRGVLLSFR